MRISKSAGTILFGVFILIFGIVLTVFINLSFKNCTEPATATVVDNAVRIETNSDNKESTMYYPIVEYVVGNKKVQAEYNVGTGKLQYELGEKIAIKYNPDDTSNFKILSDNTFTYVGYGLIAFGSVMILSKLAIFVLYFVKRR